MKAFIATLLALVLVAQAVQLREKEFMNWRMINNKFYADELEHAYRLKVFSHNMNYIENFNAARKTENEMWLGATRFADMTNEEYKRFLLPKGQAAALMNEDLPVHTASGLALPREVDWREEGAVTPVKDQGQCGSCWAFGTTGAIEGAWKNAGNDLVSLSEQNLMDCTWKYGNMGCNGGMPNRAMKYAEKHGVDTEESYPYQMKSSYSCKFDEETIGAHISSHKSVEHSSEESLQDAVANHGPVAIAIDASQMSFQFYSGGIYREDECKNGPTDLDHAVLAVGYGSNNDGDYWIVKNSWATVWGNEGYIFMARNEDNMCGVATNAVFPLV